MNSNKNNTNIRNPLLQNAVHGVPDSLLTNTLIFPHTRAGASISDLTEIDSFIGQDSNVTQSTAGPSSSESVPLVVPDNPQHKLTSDPAVSFGGQESVNPERVPTTSPFAEETSATTHQLPSNASPFAGVTLAAPRQLPFSTSPFSDVTSAACHQLSSSTSPFSDETSAASHQLSSSTSPFSSETFTSLHQFPPSPSPFSSQPPISSASSGSLEQFPPSASVGVQSHFSSFASTSASNSSQNTARLPPPTSLCTTQPSSSPNKFPPFPSSFPDQRSANLDPAFSRNPAATTSTESSDRNADPRQKQFDLGVASNEEVVNVNPPPVFHGFENSYRLTNRKKPTYAPIPGLSSGSTTVSGKKLQENQGSKADFEPSFPAMSASYTGSPSATGPYVSTTTTNMTSGSLYRKVYHHWFYRKDIGRNWFKANTTEVKSTWKPFSMVDSLALESAFSLPSLDENTLVATDGGRYDVNIMRREKMAVYWEENKSVVRRCSWFFKDYNDVYIPYEEEFAAKLEAEFEIGMNTGIWGRKVEIDGEEVVMHNPSTITQQLKSSSILIDFAADSVPAQLKPRMVKRGEFDDFDIDDGEPEKVDHLLFLVHGIGQFCDLKLRSIVEVVDEFRSISLQLGQSHFQEAYDLGDVNRIEILPVSWHKTLHSQDTGIDQKLKDITLPSIPRLRDFANDTILDVLFYTSPVFCQVINNAVATEINRLHALFIKRNPTFDGKISVGGHSLGSLILFDLMSNQPTTPVEPEPDVIDDLTEEFKKRVSSTRRISVVTVGKAGIGQPLVKYPRLNFHPRFFFAFGSPIACFVATRSNEVLGEDFSFPTCKGFFNIFHPFDPIAYRIEPLIIRSLRNVKPVQIPHHKGRKRMHLELKDTVSHVGQRLVDTVKNTWNMMYHLAINKSVDATESMIQHEFNQVLKTSDVLTKKPVNPNLVPSEPMTENTNIKVGNMNEGRRVDYVLQEAPVEYFNEYLFALASHLCYWTSRDTMLMVLKEIYADVGVCTDNQIPQTILPFDITEEDNVSQSSSKMS